MSYLDVYFLLGRKLTEAFPRSKFEDWVHELVRLAPMETLDSFNQFQALILAQEDSFTVFIFFLIATSVCRLHAEEVS